MSRRELDVLADGAVIGTMRSAEYRQQFLRSMTQLSVIQHQARDVLAALGRMIMAGLRRTPIALFWVAAIYVLMDKAGTAKILVALRMGAPLDVAYSASFFVELGLTFGLLVEFNRLLFHPDAFGLHNHFRAWVLTRIRNEHGLAENVNIDVRLRAINRSATSVSRIKPAECGGSDV